MHINKNQKNIEPPNWAVRFLNWYCAPDLLEEVEGDILEVFQHQVEKKGLGKAKWTYIKLVFKFFNYSTIKGNRRFQFQQNNAAMFKNYFKVSVRNLIREKLYTSVNLMGLALGLACAILIALFVKDELSFDRFHANADNIYRVWVKEDHGNNEIYFNATTPPVLGTTLKNELPEAAQVVRLASVNRKVSQGTFSESERILLAEQGFFSVFDFPEKSGYIEKALSQPDQIVITEQMANKYFGKGEAIGKLLNIDLGEENHSFTVAAVAQNPPSNSSIQFDFVVSYKNFEFISSESHRQSWYSVSVETYVLLFSGSSPDELSAKTEAIIKEKLGDRYPANRYQVGLQPLTDIHLNNDMPRGLAPVSDWKYSYLLGTVALFILLVAAINFMTLSIGRSFARAKEIGVRKSIGARKPQIIAQYWSEAVLMSILAMVLGVILATLFLPVFNSFSGKALQLDFTLGNIALFFGIAIFTGLISGFYPALVLSGFSPISVLKGGSNPNSAGSRGQHFFRKMMVGLQFVLSVMLVSGALIMQQQLHYMQFKDLGFEREQLIVIPQTVSAQGFSEGIKKGFEEGEVLQNQLQVLSEVKGSTISMHSFDQNGWLELGYENEAGVIKEFYFNIIDENYVPVHDIQIAQGRNFSEAVASDGRMGLLINETMAANFDWEVGTRPKQFPDFEVIGITKDFHFTSLHSPVAPAMLAINPDGILKNVSNVEGATSTIPKLTLKLQSTDFASSLAKLESIYQEVYPGELFQFNFVDEALASMYRKEQQMGQILNYATALALLIAAMGLFALVTLVVNKKAKEIGIRKVLGAPTSSILFQIGKEFMILVFLALCIATPLTWWLMEQWLADFSARISIQPLTFLLAGGIMFLVTVATISYQAYKASRLDPVLTLKAE